MYAMCWFSERTNLPHAVAGNPLDLWDLYQDLKASQRITELSFLDVGINKELTIEEFGRRVVHGYDRLVCEVEEARSRE